MSEYKYYNSNYDKKESPKPNKTAKEMNEEERYVALMDYLTFLNDTVVEQTEGMAERIEQLADSVKIQGDFAQGVEKDAYEKSQVHDAQIQEIFATMQELRSFVEQQKTLLETNAIGTEESLKKLEKFLETKYNKEINKKFDEFEEKMPAIFEKAITRSLNKVDGLTNRVNKMLLAFLVGGSIIVFIHVVLRFVV